MSMARVLSRALGRCSSHSSIVLCPTFRYQGPSRGAKHWNWQRYNAVVSRSGVDSDPPLTSNARLRSLMLCLIQSVLEQRLRNSLVLRQMKQVEVVRRKELAQLQQHSRPDNRSGATYGSSTLDSHPLSRDSGSYVLSHHMAWEHMTALPFRRRLTGLRASKQLKQTPMGAPRMPCSVSPTSDDTRAKPCSASRTCCVSRCRGSSSQYPLGGGGPPTGM